MLFASPATVFIISVFEIRKSWIFVNLGKFTRIVRAFEQRRTRFPFIPLDPTKIPTFHGEHTPKAARFVIRRRTVVSAPRLHQLCVAPFIFPSFSLWFIRISLARCFRGPQERAIKKRWTCAAGPTFNEPGEPFKTREILFPGDWPHSPNDFVFSRRAYPGSLSPNPSPACSRKPNLRKSHITNFHRLTIEKFWDKNATFYKFFLFLIVIYDGIVIERSVTFTYDRK